MIVRAIYQPDACCDRASNGGEGGAQDECKSQDDKERGHERFNGSLPRRNDD